MKGITWLKNHGACIMDARGSSVDAIDRKLLNLIQGNFPIHSEPYRILGEALGVGAEEALAKVQNLYKLGVIRRLGGVFDSQRLGYFSTLCTAKVTEDKVSLVAGLLAEIPGVTHNYLRNHIYNMWFTLIAPSREQAENTLQRVGETAGIEVFSLPALKIFKIRVDFDMGQEDWPDAGSEENLEKEETLGFAEELGGRMPRKTSSRSWLEMDRPLIRVLQKDLPHVLSPFSELARQLDCSEVEVLTRTQSMLERQVIRRFGAVLRHQKAGFLANAMGVWQVEGGLVQEAGEAMATFREVSHCYQRPTLPDWPYNLFTMIHGRTPQDCQRVMEKIAKVIGIEHYAMLFSQTELKKSSMEYFMEED